MSNINEDAYEEKMAQEIINLNILKTRISILEKRLKRKEENSEKYKKALDQINKKKLKLNRKKAIIEAYVLKVEIKKNDRILFEKLMRGIR
jgi:dTDP-4-amino-4,6-dideoxygalactose transaminase